MKKLLLSLLSVSPLLGVSVFAAPVTLDLLGGGLSLLDNLFLIGVGFVLLGILLLCIAFLKSTSKKAKDVEDIENEDFPHFLDHPDWDSAEDSSIDDAEDASEETIPEDDVADEIDDADAEDDTIADIEDDAEEPLEEINKDNVEEDKIYPKLILTNRETNDFMIVPLSGKNTVGRNQDNDLVINDSTISGHHCSFYSEDDKVYIQDENSTNGTYLNGTRLGEERAELQSGDKLSLGKQEFNISFHA